MSHGAGKTYAGFWRRFIALMIDMIIYAGVYYAVMLFTGHIDTLKSFSMGTISTPDVAISLKKLQSYFWINLWMAIALAAYFIVLTASPMRGTFGKYIMDVAIVDKDGGGIGLFRSLVREAAKIISGGLFLIGYIIAAFTPKKRALHDFIAMSVPERASDVSDRSAQRSNLRLIGNAVTAVVLVVALAFPGYAMFSGKTPWEMRDPRILATVEAINKGVAQKKEAESATRSSGQQIATPAKRRRAIDFSGIDLLRERVEEHAVSKQAFPQSFQELGVPAGDLFDRGIASVDVRNNGVMEVKFKDSSDVGGAVLVMAPYLDGEGYIKWDCRSLQMRDADFPEACSE